VQSLALLTLHDGAMDSTSNAFGMLVLGSPDPLRFDATMGLEFSFTHLRAGQCLAPRMRAPALTLAHG
jgi:uncharacterized protein YigA (DUF484 family)